MMVRMETTGTERHPAMLDRARVVRWRLQRSLLVSMGARIPALIPLGIRRDQE